MYIPYPTIPSPDFLQTEKEVLTKWDIQEGLPWDIPLALPVILVWDFLPESEAKTGWRISYITTTIGNIRLFRGKVCIPWSITTIISGLGAVISCWEAWIINIHFRINLPYRLLFYMNIPCWEGRP